MNGPPAMSGRDVSAHVSPLSSKELATPQSTTLAPSEHAYTPGPVAMGSRTAFASQVRALVEATGNDVREALAKRDVVEDFCLTIHEGIKPFSKTGRPPDRTCLNQYAQIMKLVGEERRITVEFIHGLGAKSEEELRRYVDAAKSVEGAGPHDGAERCVAYLEAYLNVYPEQRAASLRRLGGYVPVG